MPKKRRKNGRSDSLNGAQYTYHVGRRNTTSTATKSSAKLLDLVKGSATLHDLATSSATLDDLVKSSAMLDDKAKSSATLDYKANT